MATPAPSAVRARVPGRLGSEEYHSASLPTAQEAAILYSANYAEAAIALLKSEIKDALGRNNKQAWLMLFDLYQAAQNRQEFDALSMLYSVKFELSPPAWAENAETQSDPRRGQSRERKDFFAMKPAVDGAVAAEIDRFLAFVQTQGSVRLDVAKVAALSPQEAAIFTAALQKLRRARVPMWFNNLDALEKVLRAAFNERATDELKAYWLLLFELYVLEGKDTEFEELGMEYAVAFEMSPPSWEVYVNPVSEAAKSGAVADAAPGAPEAGGFALKGVLTASSANQVGEMNGHAAARSEVVVDMGRVMRIDFGFTAAFFDAVKAIQLAGKRVILTNLSELNAALLEALGVNRYAILVRRKST
ncbi:MAG TPA: STAS domain-containing protein [Usitatibacter sp.]|nr:STAS domain-containing protein [Usitatibacter sp.]